MKSCQASIHRGVTGEYTQRIFLRVPHNLPAQPTPLVGRTHELAAARYHLLRDEVRLLTLTGPAGTGKTRLAVAVALGLSDVFVDGVSFIDLSAITDPALVVPAIAQVLDLREEGRQSFAAQLRQQLRTQQRLLVLDNFEQVLLAATDVADLLAACPHVKVLVASRAALGLRWEHTFSVPPLRLPDPSVSVALAASPAALRGTEALGALAECPAVALFVQRARAAQPEFELTVENAPHVVDLCGRLDGLPLAIELAAARLKVLSPLAVLSRLEHRLDLLKSTAGDRPRRHQTLRAAIAWSYDLLTPAEQTLFCRLSAFVGGCTLEAASAVCTACEAAAYEGGNTADSTPPCISPVGLAMLDALEGLVSKSLLRQDVQPDGESRYRMLDTIREFALEHALTTGEAVKASASHASYYVALSETASRELRGPQQTVWLDRLERERDNIRAALAWCHAHGAGEQAVRLVGNIWRFWWVRGRFSEGRMLMERALVLPSAPEEDDARAEAFFGLGVLATYQGDYEAARALYEQCLSIWRRLDDTVGIGYALLNLAEVEAFVGDLSAARDMLLESLDVQRQAEDKAGIAWSLASLAFIWGALNELEKARACLDESASLFQEVGDTLGLAAARASLAHVVLDAGDLPQAEALFRESLVLFQQLNSSPSFVTYMGGVAALAGARKQFERAVQLHSAAEALLRTLGARVPPLFQEKYERSLNMAREHLDDAAFAAAWAQGQAMTLEQAIASVVEASSVGGTATHPGTTAMPPPVGKPVRQEGLGYGGLTPREQTVAVLVGRGLTNAQIARELVITEGTARIHVQNILGKLNFSSRAQIAAWAATQGLLTPSPG